MHYMVTVLYHYRNAVAEAMNRAGLKMWLFYTHKCRWNGCSVWTGQTYSSAHWRITWPCTGIISSSLIVIKFAIASCMGWRIWPWVMSCGCPATCSAAAGWLVRAQISAITHPAGFSHPLCSCVWSCTHAPHAPTTWGCTACSHRAGGSFLLLSMPARATWQSRCCQGSKKAQRQQWARCWWHHAVSSVPLPTEQYRGSARCCTILLLHLRYPFKARSNSGKCYSRSWCSSQLMAVLRPACRMRVLPLGSPLHGRLERRAAPAFLSEHIPVSARLPAAYWCCGARRLQHGRLCEWISRDTSKAGSSTCGVCCGKGWVIQPSSTGEPQIRAKQVLWPFRIKKKDVFWEMSVAVMVNAASEGCSAACICELLQPHCHSNRNSQQASLGCCLWQNGCRKGEGLRSASACALC